MRPAARVQACIELLEQQQTTKSPADRVQSLYYKQRRYIGSKDKAAISELFYGVLRQRASLDHALHQVNLADSNPLRTALFLLRNHHDIKAVFSGDKFAPSRLHQDKLDSLKSALKIDLSVAPLAAKCNFPEWLEPMLTDSLGDRLEAEMTAMNQRANTDIRVNSLKSDRQSALTAIQDAAYDAEQCELSPWGLRFKSKVALFNLPIFKQGWLEVQDEGSQLLALLTGVKAGDRVVDFCAGAGGKTLAMAAMMKNKGSIWATDVHSKRLEQLVMRKKRAGAHNIRTHLLSSENDKWVKQHAQSADIVLVDAPCTGTGTWRRNPDSRWNLKPTDIQELVALQKSILDSAKRLVKPGGALVYATCSLLKEENENQVEWFLTHNTDFNAGQIELPEVLKTQTNRFQCEEHQFRSYPGLSGTDGFYLATLSKS